MIFCLLVATTAAFAAASAFFMVMTSTITVMSATFTSVTSATMAAAAFVYVFAMKSLSEFLFGSLTNRNDFTGKVKGLSCHLMVQVHFYSFRGNFENYARYHCACSVEHRDGVAWNEKVFSYLSVYLECGFRKVDDLFRLDFAVSICRCEGDFKCRSRFHAFDMLLEFRQEAACAMYIVQRSFLGCSVNNASVHFELVSELHYFVCSNFHIAVVLISFLCRERDSFESE